MLRRGTWVVRFQWRAMRGIGLRSRSTGRFGWRLVFSGVRNKLWICWKWGRLRVEGRGWRRKRLRKLWLVRICCRNRAWSFWWSLCWLCWCSFWMWLRFVLGLGLGIFGISLVDLWIRWRNLRLPRRLARMVWFLSRLVSIWSLVLRVLFSSLKEGEKAWNLGILWWFCFWMSLIWTDLLISWSKK